MSDYFDMSGKVVLVTGGSRGLGYEMAKAFARQGADLIIASRKLDACEAVAAEIQAMGRKALAVSCHVGEWDALPTLVEAAYDRFGKVDVLVNNAGIAPTAPSSLEITEALFDKTVAINFKGPFRLSALVGERMVAAGSGSIINISSTAAVVPGPAYPVYAGAKSALNIMTRCHAFEFGPKVRVNAIMCGPFWTDIAKAWREEADRTSKAAAKRIGRPEEIATTALYLASDQSSFTTGTIIRLDGGDR
ncbi:NAD(P)-dependent dehydrogenase (short-subunit alcohol dehydrogenase family) [Caulobacter ginsengisoli]|uniref:NAD(P)-dependent dehydrogenase (Short-subunit alcohol dehydrogenase family) n=1 Tax=Caulobacter ginsengisoli TaxID=400775 RepID=A0ABU0IY10_9CAUL|nr:SDR family oxidoreductase [Caulobacter ginsengisoli]MDQ0466908.1 NAD(P)-dependent dehydrogenase (short-subunit alcohol dehydrogenase family) [Caulobacter ginsengisoli]